MTANDFGKERDDADNLSARVHGLVTFNPDTKLLLTVDTRRNKGAGPGTVPVATFFSNSGQVRRTSLTNADEGRRDDSSNGFAAELTTRTSIGELDYLAAYRTFDRNNLGSTNATGQIGTITTNAANAKNIGFELEARIAVSDSGTVSAP